MTDTHCPYCALQCAQTITPGGDDDAVAGQVVVEPRAFPTNAGGMCQKGWTSAELLRVPDRITTPLRRVPSTGSGSGGSSGSGGGFEEVSWDVALDDIAARVRAIGEQDGADAVAVFGGGGLTNEKAYQLGKFARLALRTRNIDYNGRFCMSSAAAAANRSLGVDRGLPFPLTDLADADAVVLFGSNLADTMPPAVQHLGGARERGGLVVIDPRRSATARLTDEGAGEHLQLVPGTDLVLALGLLHVVLAEGLADADYLAARVDGLDDVRRSVAEWWPERVAATTGVPETQLRRIARMLSAASPHRGGRGAFLLTGRGSEQHADGTDTVTAVINLALALGLVGAERGGYGAITGQGNGQGGREHGQKADQLPGYRMITDPAAREHVAAVWGVDPGTIPGPGVPAVELLTSLGQPGGPRALFVHGSNVLVSSPDAQVVRRRLEALDLLVVCDFVPSETALLADYILPVTQWAEEEGTMTGLEGRVLRRRRAVEPPAGVRSELEVFAELAARLDAPGTWSVEPREVYDELRRASAGGRADYAGISYDRLDAGEALYWPCPDEQHPGTPRLFADTFPTPSGRARMVAVRAVGPDEPLRAEAPVWLVTGRVLQHYQSGAQTRRVAKLNDSAPRAHVEINPVLAARIGLEGIDDVRITSKRGSIVAQARISADIRPDTVFVPFHFADEGMVNAVTNAATDPVSGMPEFKVCAVQIRREDA
ncbi:molybdopterin oxidoreductase family protein [Aeromicrobium fastidiosum]|uniref:Molybdopterin-dependent oxidoreductase n=1 Tax=Aeromicrobium fastidiosum TaxID=52699 RepID=A0A641AKX4_9ACTN|nr:molybdopterin-dependent oxidoreductase [Aeromicrobium fastidiosum]KAA1376477.1 molybdopterin-dependent oxidoreductase [Aeromicrobium fastidiosum]MBP2391606.1 assimilatory nitrate reductase catalytic subunit [Aeromicrobium fastidiosum]